MRHTTRGAPTTRRALAMTRTRAALQVALFALLVNALAWTAPRLGGDFAAPGPGLLVWIGAPLGVALLLRLIARDWRDAGFALRLRGNGRWYALALLSYPLAIALVIAIGLVTGASAFPELSASAYLRTLAPVLVLYAFFAFAEEVGWRGYLAPKFRALGLDGLRGHALVGVVWAAWHLPYLASFTVYTNEAMATFLPRFVLGCVAYAVVYGEIRLRTGSVWPAVLMHWTGNAVAVPLAALVALEPPLAPFASFGTDGVLMIALFGGLGLWLYRRRSAAHAA